MLDFKLISANIALATLNAESGSPADAQKCYQEAIDLIEPLAKQGLAEPQRRHLAMLHENLGNIQTESGQFDQARANYDTAIALRVGLIEDARTEAHVPLLADLANSEHNLGLLDSKIGRTESALSHYRRAAELREKVLEQDQTSVGNRSKLAVTLQNLGWLIGAIGRKAEARDLLRRGVALLERCVAEQPTNISSRVSLAGLFRTLGGLLEGNDARAAFARARELAEAIVADVPDAPRYRADLAETLILAGTRARDAKDFAEAINLHEKAVAIAKARARPFRVGAASVGIGQYPLAPRTDARRGRPAGRGPSPASAFNRDLRVDCPKEPV
jgi:tetratricopeptide (TPR) repeat protein